MNSLRIQQEMGKEIATKENFKTQRKNPEVVMSFDWKFQKNREKKVEEVPKKIKKLMCDLHKHTNLQIISVYQVLS